MPTAAEVRPPTAFGSLFRQAFDVQVRYYGALGRLTVNLVRALAGDVVTLSRTPNPRSEAEPALGAPTGSAPQAMVLESEAGAYAVGMFLVENHLAQAVSAPVAPSAFVDDDGHEVQPRLAFAPRTVNLEPGEQALVKVAAAMDETLLPGVAYRGTISVPGVSRAAVPVVMRRREAPAASPSAGREPMPSPPSRRARTSRRPRARQRGAR